jgi:hypothetical protein
LWGIGLHSKAFISREFNNGGGGDSKWRHVFFCLKPSNSKEDISQDKKDDYLAAFLWQRRATELTAACSTYVGW